MSDSRWHDPAARSSRVGALWPDPGPHPPGRGGRAQGLDRRRPPGRIRPWGTLPGRSGIILVIAATALGALLTAVTGGQPGFLLGAFLVAGTAAGALAVAPRAVYQLIPVPTLAYVAAAILTMLVTGQAAGTSRTALALTAIQAAASGFDGMIAATLLAIVITAARWPRGSRDPRGPGYRPAAAGTGRPGRAPGDHLSALRGLRPAGDQPGTPFRSPRDPRRDL
ncbi:MAG: DUF6542 domain-containing protein [Streptosporangiaceae bacterium]